MTKEAMIKVLRYKAEHIKAKIRPEFFAEVADMLEKEPCCKCIEFKRYAKEMGFEIDQQPCDDAISRQAALYGLASIAKAKAKSDAQKALMGRVMFFIGQLPPATPKQKTGHWFYDKSIENWRCSECNETPKTMGYCGSANFMAKHFKFCNHCGARMVEPQESDG